MILWYTFFQFCNSLCCLGQSKIHTSTKTHFYLLGTRLNFNLFNIHLVLYSFKNVFCLWSQIIKNSGKCWYYCTLPIVFLQKVNLNLYRKKQLFLWTLGDIPLGKLAKLKYLYKKKTKIKFFPSSIFFSTFLKYCSHVKEANVQQVSSAIIIDNAANLLQIQNSYWIPGNELSYKSQILYFMLLCTFYMKTKLAIKLYFAKTFLFNLVMCYKKKNDGISKITI